MKKGAWKKIILAVAIVMVGSMAGSSLSGWISEKKANTEDTGTDSQACIECVIDA